jgi:hypothetical protein
MPDIDTAKMNRASSGLRRNDNELPYIGRRNRMSIEQRIAQEAAKLFYAMPDAYPETIQLYLEKAVLVGIAMAKLEQIEIVDLDSPEYDWIREKP